MDLAHMYRQTDRELLRELSAAKVVSMRCEGGEGVLGCCVPLSVIAALATTVPSAADWAE